MSKEDPINLLLSDSEGEVEEVTTILPTIPFDLFSSFELRNIPLHLKPFEKESLDYLAKFIDGGDTNAVIVRVRGINLRKHDLRTLNPGIWVNDAIINSFIEICSFGKFGCAVASSHLYSKLLQNRQFSFHLVRKWMKSQLVFSNRALLIPINLGPNVHWIIVAVDFFFKTIVCFDSLKAKRTIVMQNVFDYLVLSYFERFGTAFDESGWVSFDGDVCKVPDQRGGNDCGAHVCLFAKVMLDFYSRQVAGQETRLKWKMFEGITPELIQACRKQIQVALLRNQE
jgi:hypothetical protein